MKKLLSITKLFVLCAVIVSCQSRKNTSTTTETKPSVTTNTEAVNSNSQTSNTSGSTGTGSGIKKDTTSIPTKTTAIIHSAPNQAQIDSIKKAKTESKKKN